MAVPKRKTSKQRKHKRAANWKAAVPTLAACPQCHELKSPHTVCEHCGFYNGKEVVKQTAKESK